MFHLDPIGHIKKMIQVTAARIPWKLISLLLFTEASFEAQMRYVGKVWLYYFQSAKILKCLPKKWVSGNQRTKVYPSEWDGV